MKRISEVPGWLDRLNAIGCLKGVGANDPRIVELRLALGMQGIVNQKEGEIQINNSLVSGKLKEMGLSERRASMRMGMGSYWLTNRLYIGTTDEKGAEQICAFLNITKEELASDEEYIPNVEAAGYSPEAMNMVLDINGWNRAEFSRSIGKYPSWTESRSRVQELKKEDAELIAKGLKIKLSDMQVKEPTEVDLGKTVAHFDGRELERIIRSKGYLPYTLSLEMGRSKGYMTTTLRKGKVRRSVLQEIANKLEIDIQSVIS